MAQRRWQDFTPGQQAVLAALAAVQLSLAVAAWVDLAARPAAKVSGGRKSVWAAVIAINFAGPVAYFARGRRT